ncbi:hypothetical protein LOTGIDRAFT_158335 [Lottia gigantea]|uniref:Uncharacterized protein n=1 Tax=Lottia gigantea TaxID=225164 RepID=V4AYF7_LOTGI|nr:hypothetical protein LOTGIDRAFT_158335 [Lottia gigantea]ESP00106.1 hypothetical protein LOTGIDRAFT_158335 [Lottia gigantea]
MAKRRLYELQAVHDKDSPTVGYRKTIMELDEEYNAFLQDLQQYPNYFQMGTEKCGSNFWKKIEKKVEDEKEELLNSSDLDRIKNQNLEACASYNLGDVDKAENIISKVLEDTHSSSINACAMMAILSYRKGKITKAKRNLSRIKELAADPYNIDVAKSELAYAYTRLNATFYKKAIAAYTEAVERNPNNFPWKFGLALIYRRCMNTNIQAMFPDLQLETCFNEAEKHLEYVLENCTDEKDRFFKARSYIELADLYSTANVTDKLINTDKYYIIDLVNKGVQCLPENTAVLMKAGKLLRHCYQFEEAEALLQKAYDICPNSYICHQLGLSQKNNIIHHHKKLQHKTTGGGRYRQNKQDQDFGSKTSPSFPSTSAPQQKNTTTQDYRKLDQQSESLAFENGKKQFDNSLSSKSRKEPDIKDESIDDSTQTLTEPKPVDIKNPTEVDNDLETDLAIEEPVNTLSFPIVSPYQTTLKQQIGSTLFDSPSRDHFDPHSVKKLQKSINDDDLDPGRHPKKGHQLLAEKTVVDDPSKTDSTEGTTILLNKSKTDMELAESLSKVSLTNKAEVGKEPVKSLESSSFTPSRPVTQKSEDISSVPTTTKSDVQNNPMMKRLINSPGEETYDFELSRKLDPCIDLFSQSAELGQERNLSVYYDWGITLLKMTPTKFDEVMEKFNHILEHDHSQFLRYRCYEQYGICKKRMSKSQDFDQTSREDYQQDAVEMFRRAIRCWAYCQKINLSKHFDDAEGNCTSFKSIREIILGEDSRHGTKPKKDMASLYYLVKKYGFSLSLYQEVHDELKHTSDTDTDSEVIQGIINNHIQLQQFTGVLDLLALLLCSKEGLKCLEFKTEVLTQMMHHSIDTNDYNLAESVFNFEKDPNEECDSDVAIIFNEDDQVTKKTGATLQNWLCDFSKSGLKVIKSSETAANLPEIQEQIKLICNSKMAIFILANDNPSEFTYLMNTALKARCSDDHILKKIFPITINDGMVPDIFQNFNSMKMTQDSSTVDEQNKSSFLKTFSKIFLE